MTIEMLSAALAVFVAALHRWSPCCCCFARLFGLYAVVQERTCRVYVLFGKVIGGARRARPAHPAVRDRPRGLRRQLPRAAATCSTCALDQEYLRSQPVNSEEGAPMGIGIWYEMWISDPVAYLFKNTDPRGSLRANVSNATVRCLSNMPLGGDARDAPQHEPDGARGGLGEVAARGATSSARSTSARCISATRA